uniref:Uncharacterized protein n=1 Tax=Stegastes partitus TaxID=144197 RepID=A0A3B5APX2_9TELE
MLPELSIRNRRSPGMSLQAVDTEHRHVRNTSILKESMEETHNLLIININSVSEKICCFHEALTSINQTLQCGSATSIYNFFSI